MRVVQKLARLNNRKHKLKLLSKIPHGSYCGRCRYKMWTKIRRDIFYDGRRYKIKTWYPHCKLYRKSSKEDPIFDEGVKHCEYNWEDENV